MSRTLRTKRTVRSKMSKLHHNVGKADDVQNLGPFDKPRLSKNILRFYENSSLNYSGGVDQLKQRFSELDRESKNGVREITLCIQGERVQREKRAWVYIMFLLGTILIIPMLILFSNWFKKKCRQIYQTKMWVYQQISLIIKECQNTEQVHLFIQDNYITRYKLDKLLSVQEKAKIVVVNVVEKVVFEGEGFDEWKDYFKGMDWEGRGVTAVWGGTRIGGQVDTVIEASINDTTEILY